MWRAGSLQDARPRVLGVAAGRAMGPGGVAVPCPACVLQSPQEVALKRSFFGRFQVVFLILLQTGRKGAPGCPRPRGRPQQCLCLGPGGAESACDGLVASW